MRKYPKLIEAVKQRHIIYNRTLEELEVLEKEGRVLVIRPSRDLGAKRFTRDKKLLERLYQLGCEDAKAALPRIREFVSDKGDAENA